jgi:hypothetical protein
MFWSFNLSTHRPSVEYCCQALTNSNLPSNGFGMFAPGRATTTLTCLTRVVHFHNYELLTFDWHVQSFGLNPTPPGFLPSPGSHDLQSPPAGGRLCLSVVRYVGMLAPGLPQRSLPFRTSIPELPVGGYSVVSVFPAYCALLTGLRRSPGALDA